jgi:hypothetical protein
MPKNQPDQLGASKRVVVGALASLVLFVLWGIACAMYAATSGERPTTTRTAVRGVAARGVGEFVMNAVVHLPKAPAVASYIIEDRRWFVGACIGCIAAVVGFAFVLERTDRRLKEGSPFARTGRKRRTRSS